MAKQADRLKAVLGRVARKFPDAVDNIVKAVSIEAANAIIDITRVDTGRLRNGWDAGIGAPSEYKPQKGAETYSDDAQNRVAQKVSSKPLGAGVYITNNVEYAAIWETGAFEPKNPGPSKGRGRKGTRRQQSKEGIVLVENGYLTSTPQGFLAVGIAAAERELRKLDGLDLGGSE